MNKFKETLSLESLNKYRFNENLTNNDILSLYLMNIKLQEAFYPSLSFLEVTLRNKIYFVFARFLNDNNWIINGNILDSNEKITVSKALTKLGKENLFIGKLIPELNFGFWVSLFKKYYRPILWDKQDLFENIFTDYKRKNRVGYINNELRSILKLRNRIAHHENIIINDENLNKYYADINEILGYLCVDAQNLLKNICRFNDIYKEYQELKKSFNL